ncbi:hypothetical protein GQ54DRAFT_22451 [Martensiomyces pterosporus]|nr:hypothetical protein GQ54DRAFT_22451 [Martensiomyces pterosporus]
MASLTSQQCPRTKPEPTTPPATAAATINNNTITTANSNIKKSSENMDKLFSIVNPAAAAQQAQAFAQQDDSNPYILPSFADNYEAWAYPETQQAVFEDWISTTATPPPTVAASPSMSRTASSSALFAGVSPASFASASPTLSPPSADLSTNSSPLIANDIALSLVSTLQSTSSAASAVGSQRSGMSAASFTVADYAAALFPDLAASLSNALATSAAAVPSEPCTMASTPSAALSPATESPLAWPADIAGLFDAPMGAAPASSPIVSAAAGPASSEAAPVASSVLLGTAADPELDESRKRRDTEFLASLPPQLALKRRRTSNMKQKEKILAEILSDGKAAGADSPSIKKASAAKKATKETAAAVAAAAAAVHSKVESDSAEDSSADAAALKRKKNTDAARRSRMRKILRIETLEGRVSELETENTKLAQMVAALEAEKAAVAQRLTQYEAQLSAVSSPFAL